MEFGSTLPLMGVLGSHADCVRAADDSLFVVCILACSRFAGGCADAIEHTITEWLSCDTEDNQLYADEEIISLVENKPQDDSGLEETDEPENVLVSHSEAANALEIALRYIEKSENATPTDIMFVRRWHNIASTSRITSLCQTNFFTPKDC
ncbi:hypothetical protein AVEN_195338-1 [Araneus ventricosus]|uniref:Uncharacterized protein n=1 Tax=Araneus ventricosus TaxID=182803 RepID=A0A4Y2NUY7_ARAVE|nr:hypothetical protein AVEN_195338-1 [Araneus ventricosus]